MILAFNLMEPYSFQFFRQGLVVATIAGALCGLLGVFVVLRGMSYIGHGLSHAVFGGAAASAVLRINFFLGAGVWGVISGLLIARVARRRVLGADAAIGVVTTASFALGLALMNRYGQAGKSIEAVLFGSVLGVQMVDIYAVSGVALLGLVVVVLGYRKLLFSTFDRDVAQVSGVNVVAHHLGHYARHRYVADFGAVGYPRGIGTHDHQQFCSHVVDLADHRCINLLRRNEPQLFS